MIANNHLTAITRFRADVDPSMEEAQPLPEGHDHPALRANPGISLLCTVCGRAVDGHTHCDCGPHGPNHTHMSWGYGMGHPEPSRPDHHTLPRRTGWRRLLPPSW